MRIIALNGSHRGEAGCTQWLLDKIAAGAAEADAIFETVVLAKHKIKPCIGCDACHTPERYLHCIYEEEDDVKLIFEKMRSADILIYATPVYVFSMSGLMKTFLDRFNSTGQTELCLTKSGLFFHEIDKDIYSKPFVILTCCGNIEPETVKNVISYFRTFSKFMDAPIVGTLARKTVGMMEIGKNTDVENGNFVLTDIANAYIQAGRELAKSGKITASTEKRANQHIVGIPYLDFLMKFPIFKKVMLEKQRNKTDNGQD